MSLRKDHRHCYYPKHHHQQQQQQIVASLDLHGYTKQKAIAATTSFLDHILTSRKKKKGDVWVCIVTGKGSHSSQGPVVRDAVQALLTKRQMKFVLNNGKGSFNVMANSGHVLYAPDQPTDTKILIESSQDSNPLFKTISSKSGTNPSRICPNNDPLPSEVAATDAAQKESKELYYKRIAKEKHAEKMLKQALEVSMKAEENSNNRPYLVNQFEDDLQRAIEMSEQSEREAQEEEEELLRILQESKVLHEKELVNAMLKDNSDDADFQLALEASRLETSVKGISSNDDDDAELLRLLEESKRLHAEQLEQQKKLQEEDAEFRRALELSECELYLTANIPTACTTKNNDNNVICQPPH